MSGIIRTIKAKDDNNVEQNIFPKTVLEAVVDSETNETLDVILDNLNEKIDNIEPGSGGGSGGTTYELSRTEDTITLIGEDGSSSEITDSSAYLSRENLLVYPYYNNTSTKDGVTFTDNNGIITANGTSTATFSGFMCRHRNDNKLVLPIGTYTLSGCPEGGSTSTYYITIGRNDSSGSWIDVGNDIGEGVTFTLTEESQIGITIAIKQDVTVENLIFKPMLEVGTVAHEYQPYNLSRQKLRSDLDNINTDVNVSDKMSKSGGIFTGNVEFEGGVSRIDITGQKINIDDLTLSDGSCHIMKYINKTNAGSTNISNVPVGSTPFTLDVELIRWASTTDYISKQVFICSSGKHQFRVRYCTSGTWGDWTTYDFTDVVSKSGDTMTGALEVSSSNYPPMTVTRSGQPYSAAIRFANSNGTLGAIGMTATGDELLRWSPDEQTIYTILDSGNYSAYAVPKTGGTFSGDVTFDGAIIGKNEYNVLSQDYYVFHTADGAGKEGYWKLCTINVTGTYAGAVIEFDMTSRGGRGKLYVSFTGSTDVSAYDVRVFKPTDSINACYIIKTSGTSEGSVFEIYVKKEEAWGNLTVNHLKFPKYMRDLITLTWSGEYVSLPPSGFQGTGNTITLDSGNYSSYALPKAGGTMTGDITFNNDKGIKNADGHQILMTSATTVTPTSTISTKKPVYVGTTNSSYVTYIRGAYVYVDAGSNNPVNSKAWQLISDQRIKTNSILLNDEDKYLTFFNNLKPRNYNYIRDEEGTNKSIGFYAQEVEEALLSAGLTNQDFDGLNILEDFEYGIAHGKDESVYFKKFYTISYEQFIPIIVNKVQHMEKEFNEKIATLEQKIKELTGGTE